MFLLKSAMLNIILKTFMKRLADTDIKKDTIKVLTISSSFFKVYATLWRMSYNQKRIQEICKWGVSDKGVTVL